MTKQNFLLVLDNHINGAFNNDDIELAQNLDNVARLLNDDINFYIHDNYDEISVNTINNFNDLSNLEKQYCIDILNSVSVHN